MKIQVDGVDLFELNDTQKQVIKDNVHADEFDEDMKRRLQWVLTHKYDQCFKSLKEEWDKKLQGRLHAVPTNPDAYAEVVFAQPDYKCRKTRELEDAASKLAAQQAKAEEV